MWIPARYSTHLQLGYSRSKDTLVVWVGYRGAQSEIEMMRARPKPQRMSSMAASGETTWAAQWHPADV